MGFKSSQRSSRALRDPALAAGAILDLTLRVGQLNPDKKPSALPMLPKTTAFERLLRRCNRHELTRPTHAPMTARGRDLWAASAAMVESGCSPRAESWPLRIPLMPALTSFRPYWTLLCMDRETFIVTTQQCCFA